MIPTVLRDQRWQKQRSRILKDGKRVGMIREQGRVTLGETRGMSRARWEREHPNPIPVWDWVEFRLSHCSTLSPPRKVAQEPGWNSKCPSRDSSRNPPRKGLGPPLNPGVIPGQELGQINPKMGFWDGLQEDFGTLDP